jgi:hypothetical protein
MLDIKSSTKGLLIPRMTTVERTGIGTPAAGLQVYDTDLNQLYFYNGTAWTAIPTGANANNYWTLSGGNIYNNTGTNVGIGALIPLAKLTVEGTDDAGPQDLFKLSKNNYGSTIFSQYYTDAGNFGTAVRSSSSPVNSFTFNVVSARFGIGTVAPGDKLEVNGNIRLTNTGTVLAGPSTTGSANSITLRAGDPYIPVGGAGGSVNITATTNMPSGGIGYTNLGPSGDINLTSGSGYNTAGGNINITAGQTSCWALTGNSHSDVNIQGGANLVAADASSINVQGGGTVGVGCPTANANGGNLILKSGIGTGTGTQGNIQLLNGNVGIGTAAPSSKLEVCGNVRVIGTIVASGTITTSAISCPSDFRYKKNITALYNPTEKLMQLNAVQYNWRREEFPNMNFNDKLQTGFIAQDLEKIFPEMVFTDERGYKSIDYSRLTPVLVETIKEQQKQLTELTGRLQAIEKLLGK